MGDAGDGVYSYLKKRPASKASLLMFQCLPVAGLQKTRWG